MVIRKSGHIKHALYSYTRTFRFFSIVRRRYSMIAGKLVEAIKSVLATSASILFLTIPTGTTVSVSTLKKAFPDMKVTSFGSRSSQTLMPWP